MSGRNLSQRLCALTFGITAAFGPLGAATVAVATVFIVLVTLMVFALLGRFARRPIEQAAAAAAVGLFVLLLDMGRIVMSDLPGASLQTVGTLLLVRLLTIGMSVGLLTLFRQDDTAVPQPTAANGHPPDSQMKERGGEHDVLPNAPTILLVAHDPALCQWLTSVLTQAKYAVLVANHGRDALAILRVQHPDLVVIERRLPDVDGLELCSLLRRKVSVPVTIVAPSADSDDTISALDHGADDVIGGFCSPPEFVARVRAILRRSPRRDLGL